MVFRCVLFRIPTLAKELVSMDMRWDGELEHGNIKRERKVIGQKWFNEVWDEKEGRKGRTGKDN